MENQIIEEKIEDVAQEEVQEDLNKEENIEADKKADTKEENKEAGEDNKEYFGAPEEYDFKSIEMPEGIRFDNALAEKFAPVAKKLNLSQDAANELVSMLAEHQKEQLGNQQELIAEFKRQELEATKIEYQKLLESDNEISGGGKEKYNAYLDVADKGYNSFASNELKGIIEQLGLQYHPIVIKHFHELGKLCGNDSIQKATIPTGEKQSAADILYGGTKQ